MNDNKDKNKYNENLSLSLNDSDDDNHENNKQNENDNQNNLNKLDISDLYLIDIEKKYHLVDKILSVGVLEEEKNLMDNIIKYKKDKKIEYFEFDVKKNLIDGKIANIQTQIIDEKLSLEGYKENLTKELLYEKKLLENLDKDDDKYFNKNTKVKIKTKERINKRIEIIEMELQQEVPEENEKEENEKENEKENEEENLKEKDNENINENINYKKNDKKEIEFSEALKKNEEKKQQKNEEKNNNNNINKNNDEINNKNSVNIELLYKLHELENEYKSALNYFKKNSLPELESDANEKLEIILKSKNLIEKEKNKEKEKRIKEESLNLPKNINFDYICGMAKKERFENYSNIIKEYNKLKINMINERNKLTENFNKLQKKDQNKLVKKI